MRLRLLVRLRAAGIAAFSGAAALAGHGIGGGITDSAPKTLILLLAVCAVPAFLVTSKQVRRGGLPSMVALLMLGQILGHVVLSLEHAGHTGGILPSQTMVGAHLLAAIGAAVLMRTLERFILVALGVIATACRAASPILPSAEAPFPRRFSHQACRPARGAWQAYGGTRAPPALV